MYKHRLLLKHCYALGDTVLFTALVRDIHRAYPGQYEISVQSNFAPVWWHNPRVALCDPAVKPAPQLVELKWGEAIDWHAKAVYPQNRHELKHILAWYHYDFERKTGVHVPVTEPKGELFFAPEEEPPLVAGRYWVIVAGGKQDATVKHWHPWRYQQVVDALREQGLSFVQCGATHRGHSHPPLEGCRNLVGQTDSPRDLFNLIRYAEGVICPITAAMHIAAVFDKPCIVLAGGREEPWFEWYGPFGAFGPECPPVKVPHKLLHTVGHLWCCKEEGCWKNRVVPLEPADLSDPEKKKTLCHDPKRQAEGHAIASCMDLIQVAHVTEAVMDYYDAKILPPITLGEGKVLESLSPSQETLSAQETLSTQGKVLESLSLRKESPTKPVRQAVTEVLGPPQFAQALPALTRAPSVPPKEQPVLQRQLPAEFHREAPKALELPLLDHPTIGGKVTVCVLCYGQYTDIAKRCLDSILATVPRQRMDLRIATNAASADTVKYVTSLEPDRMYIHGENRMKYPVMREMFNDPDCPLATNYVVWFDDDAYVVNPHWLSRLAETIIANHKHGCRMYGIRLFHDLALYAKNGHRPDLWFRQASWYRGMQFTLRGTEEMAPNGSCINFAAGWFWALAREAIQRGEIPDSRLNHNGGDITIGEQIHQLGYKTKEFNKGKVFVYTPPKDQGGRRDYEESFPWVNPEAVFSRPFIAKHNAT